MTEPNGKPTEAYAAAIAKLQTKLPRIKKGETAQVRSDKGSYSYNYADLADVSEQLLPLLGELGLSFSARPTLNANGVFVLAYELLHVSGEGRCGEYPLPTGGTPQSLGSAITYGRRYCLCAITGVAPDDDDDDGAAASTYERSTAPPQTNRTARASQPEAPQQAPPADTDWTWISDFENRLNACQSTERVDQLKTELMAKFKANEIEPTKANELIRATRDRKDNLEEAGE